MCMHSQPQVVANYKCPIVMCTRKGMQQISESNHLWMRYSTVFVPWITSTQQGVV